MRAQHIHRFTVIVAGTLLFAAGSACGAGASKVEELPVRSGDWSPEEVARGREQLVRAFDAAWVRVIASGKDRDILATEPVNQPGAAKNYIVRLADCLPQPDLVPWPEQPVGMFRDILATGVIRDLVQGVPETPQNTSWYFSGVSRKYQDAVLAEIEDHYGVTLAVESVTLPPGRLPATSVLNAGKVDFISQLNATGGSSQEMRRRTSRRFTCTMTASSQFVHIPAATKRARQVRSIDDLAARPDLRVCAGPLTTQTARAFLPQHKIQTKYINDLSACDQAIEAGKLDVIINPLPDLAIAGLDGYRSVPTHWVAGTPLWVAAEGIECPADGDPKTEDRCFETDPP